MDGTDSEDPIGDGAANDKAGAGSASSEAENTAEADRAAEGLKGQIAALRRQVREAQNTLRDHKRRTEEGRSFKR